MGKKKGKHINKTIKKLSNFFNESETFSAVTFIGMYDINTKHFLTAFKYYLKTGINTLDEYSDLQYISWDINGKEEIYYDEERRNRIYQYLNKENYWNIYDVLDNKKLALLKSILIESKNRDSYKQSYKVRRKQASIYTANLKLRKKIFKRDGAFCRICGSKENLELDHIMPVKKGGKDIEDNLQVLCKSCNASKSDKTKGAKLYQEMSYQMV